MLLKEFRSHAQALPDLLPWAALIDNGVVLTKSGGLLAGFEFRGPDLDSATKEELAAVSARINAALALDDGWSLHVDAIRRQSPGYPEDGAFPDRTTRLLDDCRRLAHEGDWAGFQSEYRLVLCWHPDPDAAAKVEMLFVDGAQKTGVAERSLMRFKTALADIESRLAGTLKIHRLLDKIDSETGAVESPVLAHLAACVALQPRSHFTMATVPMYLDSVLGQHDFVTGFEPRIDNKTAICIAVTGFPGSSFPGILDFLSRLPVEYRWSNRFIFMSAREADKTLGRYRSQWAQKRLSLMNLMRSSQGGAVTHVNADADDMAADAVAAMAEASSGLVRFGYYTSVILLSGSDLQQLRDAAQYVTKMVANAGFSARVESVNAVEAYLGSMPGNMFANVRRPLVSYLFHRLEQRFQGQPTLLVLDEAWIMLGHPTFRAKIREWLKVLRKSNVAVIFATQSLSDLANSGIADVIFESCPSKILLPNPQVQTDALCGLYQSIGLNRRQIQIVSNATPKRQYYHMHPDGSRVFELGLTAPEMVFVGASGREDLARVRQLQKQDGRTWPSAWLRERGQSDAARLWDSY